MKTIFYSGILICFISWGSVNAQGILASLPEDEQDAIEAVALYPQQERAALLIVAQHPEILVRMDLLRQTTESAFTSLIAVMSEEDQKRIYNLSRYPELLSAMAAQEKRWSNQELNDLLIPYADEIQADARDINRKYFDLIREVHQLDMRAGADFERILEGYPMEVREAATQLASLPAILSVLSGNMAMTVLLGDLYRQAPGQLQHELDSLNIILAEQQARELEEWKQELEENPEAMAEYEAAAREFAAEDTDYDDEVYDGPLPDRYREEVYVHHVWRPYSYWFGWPSWYAYECWYPYPWWYHWGYYYGPGRVIVIVGLPSNYFFEWHFRHHRHFYHYPHFTDHIFRHYYGPRDHASRVQPVLRQWEQTHRGELPSHWMDDDRQRVDRIREFGKFKMEYEDLQRIARDKAPTEREFLRSNADRYPTLKPVLKEKPEPPRSQPPAAEPRTRTEPVVPPPSEKTVRKDVPRQEEIDRAKERHENTWNRQRTEPRPQQPPPSTTPRTREKVKTTPKPPTKTRPVKEDPPKSQPPKKDPQRKKDG